MGNWIKHGKTRTKEYRAWLNMKARCDYHPRYIERDFRVCDRWLHSFENFLVDMGPCPEGYTLERIDNEKGYEPDNCKWATWDEQNANRRFRLV